MTQKTALVVFSGGQDSTTCLYHAIAEGHKVHALTINYAQKHMAEIQAAKAIFAAAMEEHKGSVISHEILSLGPILLSASPLVSGNPLEQYENHSSLPGGIEKTFVPMRNQLFLTLAANRAIAIGADLIVTGVCEEDFGGYPDCREVFISALQKAINLGNEGAAQELEIQTPLMFLTKAETVQMAVELSKEGFNAYKALGYSHTAYDGQYPPVGKDHANLLREKGFFEAQIPDPLVLRAVREGLMPMPEEYHYSPEVVGFFQKFLN